PPRSDTPRWRSPRGRSGETPRSISWRPPTMPRRARDNHAGPAIPHSWGESRTRSRLGKAPLGEAAVAPSAGLLALVGLGVGGALVAIGGLGHEAGGERAGAGGHGAAVGQRAQLVPRAVSVRVPVVDLAGHAGGAGDAGALALAGGLRAGEG